MNPPSREKSEKKLLLFRIVLLFAIACCFVLLFPQARSFIVEMGEKWLDRKINHDKLKNLLLTNALYAIFFFGIVLLSLVKWIQILLEKQTFLEKYGKKIFVFVSIAAVAVSITVIIVMYIKGRSLWADEEAIAQNIVTRNWHEILVPPLSNGQSAPVLYVIVLKAIGSIFGYSEFSLRIPSFFAFIGLLFCQILLLKNALDFGIYRISLVVVITALLPSYIRYSNELKPYMGDAFFAVLILLLYFFYTKDKIKLPTLTALYILILGSSTPAIFFIGGVLFCEFLAAAISKNKKQLFAIFASGIVVIAIFILYYRWWMLPIVDFMDNYWNKSFSVFNTIKDILTIFTPNINNSDSFFLWFFVPFALLGILSLIRSKNKIACSVAASLFFVFCASVVGKWPLAAGRLWLFLPAVVLIFTPIGIDFIHDKVIHRKITEKMEICIFLAMIISLSAGCFEYITGEKKMYIRQAEINPLVHYVQKNIKENEKLYVYPSAKGAFGFKNGYNTTKIGNVSEENIIYGENSDEWSESSLGNELQLILKNKKTYLIFYHMNRSNINIGLEALGNYGTLTEIMNVYNTPLYYFEKYADNE